MLIAGLASLFLVVAGCGGDDGGAGGSNKVKSGDDLAELVGCTGFTDDTEEMFVTEGGSCSLEGQDINIYYFGDQRARDEYLEIATGFGGLYLVGVNWLVEAKRATLAELKAEHGGKISDE
jgi:hypothetical protein